MKRVLKASLALCLCISMLLSFGCFVSAANDPASAAVSPQSLYVNGERVICDKYNIGGYNYFKLRDLAYVLNGTPYQFGVAFDAAKQTVAITKGAAYSAVGGELAVGTDNSSSSAASSWTVYVDGKKMGVSVYNLAGNNYFKLRDLGNAIGFGVEYDSVSNAAVVTAEEGYIYRHVNDGSTNVTGALFNTYFGGDAKAAVVALMNAGKVYINGLKVPATADEMVQYNVNMVKALWKESTGWGISVHKTTKDATMAFEDARLELVETVSTVCGHTTALHVGADGKVDAIYLDNVETVLVTDISYFNESTHIKRGDFDLETNRGVRPDVNNIVFNTKYFDMNIQIGDFAVYYYGPNGWVINRATPVVGTIKHATGIAGGAGYILDGADARRESNVSRYCLRTYNRPTQFWEAYSALGLTDIKVNTWCTSTGHPIGFSYGANGKAALKQAIAFCKSAKEKVVISENGEDVPVGKLWVNQEAMNAFDAAIAAAETVSKNNATAIYDNDKAIYTLYIAYGQGGTKPSGFVGAQGGGTAEPTPTTTDPTALRTEGKVGNVYTSINDGSTKITDAKYDKYFKSGAAAGVTKLLNAGKVYINGIKVPATETETGTYNINMVKALWKESTGWGISVHKTTKDATMTFDAARLELVETVSTICGHYVEITLGSDGYAEKINMNNVETVFVTDITSHGTTTEIKRGNFQLETNRGVRPDVDTLSFPIDTSIDIGDFVMFWYGENGWVCKKAIPVTGTIKHATGIAGGTGYIINGTDARRESNVSRYNLRECNRPTQFWNAYDALGLSSIQVAVWCTDTGNPIGFSYGKNGKAAMKSAVEFCKAAMKDVQISVTEDGKDVPVGKKWVSREVMENFQAALLDAEKFSISNSINAVGYDQYIYQLYQALGQGGSKPSGFIGNQGDGEKA